MNLPWQKKFRSEHIWEYEPYAFEPGRKYVIEIDRNNVSLEEIKSLDSWFMENGLNVKLVLTKGKAIHPIRVARMTENME